MEAQTRTEKLQADVLLQAEQLTVDPNANTRQETQHEQQLREKLQALRPIALHKRALSVVQLDQGDGLIDQAEFDGLTNADPPLPEAQLKARLVALLVNYHKARADAVVAQYYGSAIK